MREDNLGSGQGGKARWAWCILLVILAALGVVAYLVVARQMAHRQLKSAQALLAAGDNAEAADAFQAIVRNDPSNAAALRGEARALDSVGEHQEAADLLRKDIAAHPQDREALLVLGWLDSGLGQLTEGQRVLQKCTRLSPRDPEGWKLLAGVARRSAEHRVALDAYRHYLRLRPKEGPPYILMADEEFETGADPRQVKADVTNGLSLSPGIPAGWMILGRAEIALHQPQAALQHLNHGLELATDRIYRISMLYLRAQAEAALHQQAAARADLAAAAQIQATAHLRAPGASG